MTGSELKTWRQSRGYSREFIGDIVGKGPRTIEFWEQKKDKQLPTYAEKLIGQFQRQNALRIVLDGNVLDRLVAEAAEKRKSPEQLGAELLTRLFGPEPTFTDPDEPAKD